MSSGGTKKAKKTGIPTKGKKAAAAKKSGKQKARSWVADLGLESGTADAQVPPRRGDARRSRVAA